VCGGAVAKRALVEILRRGKAAPHDDIVSGGEGHTTGVMATPRKTQRKAPASESAATTAGHSRKPVLPRDAAATRDVSAMATESARRDLRFP